MMEYEWSFYSVNDGFFSICLIEFAWRSDMKTNKSFHYNGFSSPCFRRLKGEISLPLGCHTAQEV